MTLDGDDSSLCSSNEHNTSSLGRLTPKEFGGEDGNWDYPEKVNSSPNITPIYNGKELDISTELMCHALSGISLKHYDGSCVQLQRKSSEESLLGEDYFFDYGESLYDAVDLLSEERSKTMSSMIKLCYVPKKEKDLNSENVPEGGTEFGGRPLCVLERIHDRNSFWNLHRPELCKLTWPHVYVGEATITEHLHRHLLSHGRICAGFHEHQDMVALLNKELDSYDKLKELQSPMEIPPDEKPFDATGNRKSRKSRPCKPCIFAASGSFNWNDEGDIDPYQSLHVSKEEFCITIGKPIRKPALKGAQISEPEQLWLPGEDGLEDYGEYREYLYPEYWEEADYVNCEGEAEESNGELAFERESAPQQPVGWVEPDFCAMI